MALTTRDATREGWDHSLEFLRISQLLRVGDANTMNVFVSKGVCQNTIRGFAGEVLLYKFGMFPKDTFSATDLVGICDSVIGPS